MTTTENVSTATVIESELDGLAKDWTAAERWVDRDLTDAAQYQRREQMIGDAKTRRLAAVQQIADEATVQAKAARARMQEFMFDPGDVPTFDADRAWQHNVAPTLQEQPHPDWRDIINNAGPAELAGLALYGRTYIRRKGGPTTEGRLEAQRTADAVDELIQVRHFQLAGPQAKAARNACTTAEELSRATAAAVQAVKNARAPKDIASATLRIKSLALVRRRT